MEEVQHMGRSKEAWPEESGRSSWRSHASFFHSDTESLVAGSDIGAGGDQDTKVFEMDTPSVPAEIRTSRVKR